MAVTGDVTVDRVRVFHAKDADCSRNLHDRGTTVELSTCWPPHGDDQSSNDKFSAHSLAY